MYSTKGPGDGTREVRARCQHSFDAVIAAGGDGTVREVIEGLVGTSLPLGILPWGTGNVFAQEMGFPRRTKSQCRIIASGRSRALDLGFADGRPFLMMASLGLDAYALGLLGKGNLKHRWGRGAYALAGLVALFRYPQRTVRVLVDGVADRGSFLLLSNTKLYGSWFVFHPRANPRDGLLDVLVFRDVGRWAFLGLVLPMLARTVLSPRSTQPAAFLARHGVYRASKVSVEPNPRLPVQLDGDPLPGGATTFLVGSHRIRVLLPR